MNVVKAHTPASRSERVVWLQAIPPRNIPSDSTCGQCDAADICEISALGAGGLVSALDTQIGVRALHAGEIIYRSGDTLRNLYVPRCGICKNVRLDREGRQQVTGFKIAGECFGTDGIASGKHESEATALQDMQVCVLPYLRAEALADALPELHRGIERMLSKELMEKEALLMLIASGNAEQRIAAFLLDLGARFGKRTSNRAFFPLSISREDIGAHLGLTLETVSRIFSRLRRRHLIDWEGRVIRLLDIEALERI